MGNTYGLSKFEISFAEKVYNLFREYEWMLQFYHGRPTQIENLTYSEIGQLRDMLKDPMDGELAELLDFTGFREVFGLEDKPCSEGDLDVTFDLRE